jgi:hypothetical protein
VLAARRLETLIDITDLKQADEQRQPPHSPQVNQAD